MKRFLPLAREYRRFETLHKRFNIFFHGFVNSPKRAYQRPDPGFPRDGFSSFSTKISPWNMERIFGIKLNLTF